CSPAPSLILRQELIVADVNAPVDVDDFVVAVQTGVDLPLIAGNECQCRAIGCQAEAVEFQRIAWRGSIADEIGDRCATVSGCKHEIVVASAAGKRVDTAATVDGVVAAVADQGLVG